MFGQTWYFALLRKYVTLVGHIFDDIKIIRTDTANNTTQLIKVPITYSAKDKMLTRVKQDPAGNRPFEDITPIISFERKLMAYDGTRKLPRTNFYSLTIENNTKLATQFEPVPWNIQFDVHVFCRNMLDADKIIEQILPFFAPDWTTKLILVPEINEERDISIIIENLQYVYEYEGDLKDRSILVWTFELILKGWFYGPVNKQPPIRFANTSFYLPKTNTAIQGVGITPLSEVITVQPGLTANGQPTSNLALSIPYSDVPANSDYGYIITDTTV